SNAAAAVISDDSAYVYAAGWMDNKPTGIDFAAAKYNPDGERLWVRHYDNSSGDDLGAVIALDTAGNVYVAGKSAGAGSGYDYATVKYDNDGNQVWAMRYNGPGNADDAATGLAVDDSMNVYVSGWSYGGASGLDYATVKYNASGVEQWVKRYDGPTSGTDSVTAMVLDGFDALYVTGVSQDTINDYQTIRYDAGTGDSVWGARYFSTTGPSIPRAMLLRASSELYVTGSSRTDSSGSDIVTIRYNADDGTVDWESRYDGADHADDDGYALSVQGASRLYVTGKSVRAGAFTDVLTIRYNQSNGAENWASSHNGVANDDDAGVAVGGGNNPTVLASSIGPGTGHDVKLIRYNASGSEQWSIRYNGPSNGEDVPYALHENEGAIYVAAASTKSKGKGTDFVVIKHVDPDELKYRTIRQADIIGKGVNLKSSISVPNFANLRDEAFAAAFPKIKKGFAGAPGGMVLGQARPDSASAFGWIRISKGANIAKFIPQTGTPDYFAFFGGKPFLGEKKNPKLDKYDNEVLGELIALRINIGASDAEVTPPTFGDLTYDDGDTSNPYNEMTLREIAATADNYLTYGGRYAPIDWARLDTVLEKINAAFYGPLTVISKIPFITTGVLSIDSVEFLQPAAAPMLEPLNYRVETAAAAPVAYELFQNYPNPFNPSTTIEFALRADAVVSLRVYDMLGREVARLLESEPMDQGLREVEFEASGMSTGIYYYVLSIGDEEFRQSRRMLLMK
ncbi:MAG TPA: T9SS type A sorting domain-containing protein, partial [Bacteroidota bacterium]|nr:T9SS type A sorting domain-containing protein [Bacteroidota bacterium]